MGDRANVQFRTGPGPQEVINLYAHWAGPMLVGRVQEALNSDAARDRWNDPAYGCRIVVHQVLSASVDPNSSTGYGLSAGTSVPDNEYPITTVDFLTQTVSIEGGQTFTFDAFCALSPEVPGQMVAAR